MIQNENMTREGRYTGPSLQAVPEQSARLERMIGGPIKATPCAKRTREMIAAERNSAALANLQAAGGIVAFGAWQTGTGNYKKARAVPVGAVVWTKEHAQNFSAYAGATTRPPVAPPHVCAWFAAHPRAQRCIALMEQK